MSEKLEKKRHSLSHILAYAVKELYGKEVKPAIGPVIDNGFYYDFDNLKISDEDLSKIEEKMKDIIKKNMSFEQYSLPLDEAIAKEEERDEPYKAELIKDLKAEGETEVSYFKVGNFDDLCRGPHVDKTGEIDAQSFTLHKLAGAYWRGDEKNKMLTRVYGLAFNNKKELKAHLLLLAEAQKRDHRKLGKELNLFVFSEVVGKGLPMLTEKGATIRRELERFIVDEEIRRGYRHVVTPDLAKIDLYKKSGHYPYYKDSMYAPIQIDDDKFMLRPMACPHHFELYLSEPRSYRDLPMRIAELAKLYRYEQSGELTGLIRARSFCLADSHIICADTEQAGDEVNKVLDLIEYISETFGLKLGDDYWYRLSLGDRKNEKKYFKNDKAWDEAEAELRSVLKDRGVDYIEAEDEAAFYGPKIDVQMKNVMGKEDTAFTVQYDFVMPKRFELKYTDQHGEECEAIVIHRSSIGAIERVMAFLIEYYAGSFPIWLSPVQVQLISVGADHIDYCRVLEQEFIAEGIRVKVDDADETVGNKVRKAVSQKHPYILVIGDKEVESEDLNVRDRGEQKARTISKSDFIKEVKEKIKNRSL